ncbi:Tat-linked quality control protein TatD [uncultured archaeon]|nr:Tat-linked quality control protein TatD [uncultured archaeon]
MLNESQGKSLRERASQSANLQGVIDAHCHLDFKQFNKDRDSVLERARSSGVVRMINSGVDYSTNQKSLELAKKYDFISVTLGLSPNTLDDIKEIELNRLMEQIRENSGQAIGIGEAGLDYYHCKDAGQRQRQAEVFKKVIDMAESLHLPLVIHSRDAEQQALNMVKHLDKVVFHCYSGSLGTMKDALDRGYYISLATNICRSGHHQILARNVSLEQLLIETDSPFLSPRGGRNEPCNVLESVRLIGRIRGMEPQEIATKTSENTKRIYNIR